MSQIGFKAKIVAPYFAMIPPEIEEKWLSGSKKSASKTYQGIKKAIKTKKDFDEKIGDKLKKTIASFIDPKFISESGRTYRNIMDKTQDSLKKAGKNYIQGIKDVFETGRYEEKLEQARKEYARKWCQYLGPLKGYKASNILGLSTMAIMALTGERKLIDYLRGRNVSLEGEPTVITTPERINEFKNILVRRIVRWGSEIIGLGFEAEDIKQLNGMLNQLVNEYRREGIIPFTPAGDSHIDFIVEEIPHPVKPGEKIKQLGLDIQVSK